MQTTRTRLKFLLLMPLKPVQLMLAVTSITTLLSLLVSNGHLNYLFTDIHGYGNATRVVLASLLVVYALLNTYCCISIRHTRVSKLIRYTATLLGILIWSFCLTLELTIDSWSTTFLPIIPILAESWALAQLISKVREADRRAI